MKTVGKEELHKAIYTWGILYAYVQHGVIRAA